MGEVGDWIGEADKRFCFEDFGGVGGGFAWGCHFWLPGCVVRIVLKRQSQAATTLHQIEVDDDKHHRARVTEPHCFNFSISSTVLLQCFHLDYNPTSLLTSPLLKCGTFKRFCARITKPHCFYLSKILDCTSLMLSSCLQSYQSVHSCSDEAQ